MTTLCIVLIFLLVFLLWDFGKLHAQMPKRTKAVYLTCMAAAAFYLCASALQKQLPSPLEPLIRCIDAIKEMK